MGDIFRSAEALAQDGALNDYANRLRRGEEKRAEENEKVNDFNERLRGITEPIGGILAGKPLESVIKSGLKKALGQGAKAVEQKLSDKLSQFVAGNTSLHDTLPSNVSRSIKSVLSDEPPTEVRGAFKNLSFKARNTINQARERLGKRPINLQNEEPTPVSATDTPSNVDDQTFRPTDTGDVPAERVPPGPTADDPSIRSVASDREGWENWVEDNLPEVDNAGADVVEDLRRKVLQNPIMTDDLPASRVKTAFLAEGGPAGPRPASPVPGTVEEPTPASTSQPSADVSDPDNSLGGIVQNTDTPTANASELSGSSTGELGTDNNLASTSGADADEAVSGLGEVADVLDATAVAQGGADIFSDILAGVVGLASIIGGEAGAKKPVPQQTAPLGSAIQYGV